MSNPYRVLITGSREWSDRFFIQNKIEDLSLRGNIVIVHGGCKKGVDEIVNNYCLYENIEQEIYTAKWEKHGKRAGILRNQQMVDTKPDLCLSFWNGKSTGTKDCINKVIKAKIPINIFVRYY